MSFENLRVDVHSVHSAYVHDHDLRTVDLTIRYRLDGVDTAIRLEVHSGERATRLSGEDRSCLYHRVGVGARERKAICEAIERACAVVPPLRAPFPCDNDCPSWGIFDDEVQRCDECWHGEENAPYDEDYADHPVCQAALAAELERRCGNG
jgi:hypothetical protein